MAGSRRESLLIYNIGRVFGYLLVALLFSLIITNVTKQTQGAVPWVVVLRFVAGVLLIYMGLQKLLGFKAPVTLQKIGNRLWGIIRGWVSPLIPPQKRWQMFVIGCAWGWLPCGMVYAALTLALTTNSVVGTVFGMLFFALGTLPTLLTIGLFGQSLLKHKKLQTVLAVFLIVIGIYTIVMPFVSGHSNHSGHAGHQIHGQHQQQQ